MDENLKEMRSQMRRLSQQRERIKSEYDALYQRTHGPKLRLEEELKAELEQDKQFLGKKVAAARRRHNVSGTVIVVHICGPAGTTVRVHAVESGGKRLKTDKQPEKDEWQLIWHYEWPDSLREELKKFEAAKGAPVSGRDVDEAKIGRINRMMERYTLPYGIYLHGKRAKSVVDPNRSFQIYVMT